MNNSIKEIWKPIPEFNDYEISNLGRVRSHKFFRGKLEYRILKCGDNGLGYKIVSLSRNSKLTCRSLHRLVAEAFIPNPNCYKVVNHINEDPSDNRAENLEWCTQKYNCNYKSRSKRIKSTCKEKYGTSSLRKGVKIGQYDYYGNLINTFNSMMEAARYIGCNQCSISQCCNGRLHQVKGYIWKTL